MKRVVRVKRVHQLQIIKNLQLKINQTKYLFNFIKNHYCYGIRKFISQSEIKNILADSLRCKQCAIWGDAVSRNVFVKKDSFSAIDFESAITYDPAFDLGLFLSQPAAMMLSQKKFEADYEKFIQLQSRLDKHIS